ncbi:MAG: phosphoribosylaminoimidazolesuccinocarboxamide synthase [Microthrixaceae bacterium]
MKPISKVPEIGLKEVHAGKVRHLFDAGDDRLIMVATDRLSAFDVVMAEPVPDKGRVLTAMSAFWFRELSDVIDNHLISTDLDALPESARRPELSGRTMLCRRVEMLPIESIVRGYIAGSAWKEYRNNGTIHQMPVVQGLREAEKLPEPIYTPSTKAEFGTHDENITFDRAAEIVGGDLAEQVREVSLAVFRRATVQAESSGFLLADTKFEFGLVTNEDGSKELVLADEVLTPDSSRFWAVEDWSPGATPQGFDKQPVRDFLESLYWDKRPPAPPLPVDVIAATSQRYREAYERITGLSLDDWYPSH